MISLIFKFRIWFVLLAFLMMIFVVKGVFAMDSSSSAGSVTQKYHLIFPIADLGNCNSLTECKNYCEDVSHMSDCINFAKNHGFYKAPPSPPSESSILEAAKSELGCDSKEACQQFCGLQENWIKCGEFAKKHSLGKPQPKPEASSSAVLEKAKAILGCLSYDQCKSFCSVEQNRIKCQYFGRIIASLKSTVSNITPKPSVLPNITTQGGSCNSFDSCVKFYCSRYPDQCQQITEKLKSRFSQNTATQSASPSTSTSTFNEDYYQKYMACTKTPSCTWQGNNGGCVCNGSPTPSVNPESSVQGVSISPNFFQILAHLFFGM